MRKAIFDLLISNYLRAGLADLDVADLFAGSGALGFEALSRGANSLQSVEKSDRAIRCIHENARILGVQDRVHVRTMDLRIQVPSFVPAPHLIFCDPPYALDASQLLQNISAQVREGAILCYEHSKDARPVLSAPWRLRTRRTWGAATVSIFECIN